MSEQILPFAKPKKIIAVDLQALTPRQKEVAHRFLDALMRGNCVSFVDFPEIPREEFEALADAIVATAARKH